MEVWNTWSVPGIALRMRRAKFACRLQQLIMAIKPFRENKSPTKINPRIITHDTSSKRGQAQPEKLGQRVGFILRLKERSAFFSDGMKKTQYSFGA
ncbi:hypothetical protein RRG08_047306 [Elysia crispata]|uniref:Uncharacterized protein n=1 Tax=Elysia crispata TaxID=231223 RepID=A0AAE1D7N9_9GAST|nr:hypothetical protein RRG08_047306 [Elysia crispata]